jgi:glutamyl-tRNA reductase
MNISNWGINHNTADVSLREKLAISSNETPELLRLLSEKGTEESLVLSTCNRTEIYTVSKPEVSDSVIKIVSDFKNIDTKELQEVSYLSKGRDTVQHLFRVASSMDSMVVGEPEILGQVKQAYATAVEFGSVKKILSGLFQRSFNLAKKIRTETDISSKPTSVGAVATKLALQIFGKSGVQEILIVGAGQMAEVSLKNIIGQISGCKITICNRTVEKAKNLANTYGGSAIGYEDLNSALSTAEIVITSLGGDKALISLEQLQKIQGLRNGHPLFMIDLGVPRNISPDCSQLDDIYIYDMDDLHNFVNENKDYRKNLISTCEPYLHDGVEEFEHWYSSLDNQSVIQEILNNNHKIIEEEFSKIIKKLPELNDNEQKELKFTIERILKKAMHQPIHSIRNSHPEDKPVDWRKIFLK